MSTRVWRQLADTVPNADTPAQTARLRLMLQSMLHDPGYTLDEQEAAFVKERLTEVGWAEGTRRALEVIAARWEQQRITRRNT